MSKNRHFLIGSVITGVRRMTVAEAERRGLRPVGGYDLPKVLVVKGPDVDALVLPKDMDGYLGKLAALVMSGDPVEGRELVSV